MHMNITAWQRTPWVAYHSSHRRIAHRNSGILWVPGFQFQLSPRTIRNIALSPRIAILRFLNKKKVCILVNTEHVVAVKPARNRRTAVKRNQADHLEEVRWLQGRYIHRELCRLLSHLINISGVITILTYSFWHKSFFEFLALIGPFAIWFFR